MGIGYINNELFIWETINMIKYSVVIPAYNEEAVIETTYNRLTEVMKKSDGEYELVFINDGSRDATADMLSQICGKDSSVRLINFSRNFGHQIAVTAGMDYAQGQAIVIIDADLQDPPEVILEMIEKWKEGYDVVYGKRKKRKGETVFKKATAAMFYRILDKLTTVEIPVDTGDFRLIDRKVCDVMKSLSEQNRYVRGLVSWVGFKQTPLEYDRHERFAGETKYPLKKMLKFAADGITSFSYKPLKLANVIGITLCALSVLYLLIALIIGLCLPAVTMPAWALALTIALFFNGITMIMLGIMGEYIGRIYDEVKGRPLYVVKETKGFNSNAQ